LIALNHVDLQIMSANFVVVIDCQNRLAKLGYEGWRMRPGKFHEVVHRTFRNTFGGTDEPVSAEASRSKVMSHECLPKYTSDKCKQIDTSR
jgi:hypothetical protein